MTRAHEAQSAAFQTTQETTIFGTVEVRGFSALTTNNRRQPDLETEKALQPLSV